MNIQIKMKTNQKTKIKLTALIAGIFFSLSTAFAQPGVIDIIMNGMGNCANTNKIIQVPVEQHKLYSIVLVKKSGEKFKQTIRLNSRTRKVNFALLKGFYKVIIVEVATGFTRRYTTNCDN